MTREELIARLDVRLKPVRSEYQLTQEQMARALGLSKKTLVEIEKGRSSLGWMGAVAFASLFEASGILQDAFSGSLSEEIAAAAFSSIDTGSRPQTLGGHVWWYEVEYRLGWRLQRNILSGHYRLLDPQNCRRGYGMDAEPLLALLTRYLPSDET